MTPIRVTPVQVAAARLRVACDKKLGRVTPAWITRLAEARPTTTTGESQ